MPFQNVQMVSLSYRLREQKVFNKKSVQRTESPVFTTRGLNSLLEYQ